MEKLMPILGKPRNSVVFHVSVHNGLHFEPKFMTSKFPNLALLPIRIAKYPPTPVIRP
jgi:hypothetical protein